MRSDHIGKPVFATDATGAKVWEATYLPFGGVHTSSGANITLRFPGQWFQSESGLHQNWMRDYDPTTGRYIQADPLGLVDGASVYGYVGQNPSRYIDPRGELGIPGAVGGAIAGGVAGYLTTGCIEGAVVGAGALAGATGGALGLTSLGAGAVGFVGAGAGQIGANYLATGCGCGDGEPIPFNDLITSPKFWFTNLGGAAGAFAGSAFGNRAAYQYGRWRYGAGAMFNASREASRAGVESLIAEGVGGLGAGVGEYVGSRFGR